MAAEFTLDVSGVSFPVCITGRNEAGEPVTLFQKRYVLDLGNKEIVKKIYASCQRLSELVKSMQKDDTALDAVEDLAKEIISATLGDWDDIWAAANHNVYAITALSYHLAQAMKEDSAGAMKRYGL
jgi:hypothetical protein